MVPAQLRSATIVGRCAADRPAEAKNPRFCTIALP
jgi:hypothetical protein